METIWAPWRMEYITRPKGREACFLCLPPEHSGPDRGRLVLYSDHTVLAMMNLYPYSNGHVLIAPRRHVATILAATEAERLAIMNLAAKTSEILTKVMAPQGFNMGINQGKVAGGSVEDHLHFNITPRYLGDCNYMTAVGETRVISEHIHATYDKLLEHF
jgi:ATP adenylyltransferase